MGEHEWAGDERRGVPLHILNFVQERIDASAKATREAVTKMFAEHEQHERLQYERLSDRVGDLELSLENRHDEVTRRLDSLMQSLSALRVEERAFHENPCPQLLASVPEGDLNAHKKAHEHMMKAAEEARELFRHIKKTVITAAIVSVGAWVALAAWQAFLQGPKP